MKKQTRSYWLITSLTITISIILGYIVGVMIDKII